VRRIRLSLPSPAAVISVVALFVALGGTGYAATKIIGPHARTARLTARRARRIADNEITKKAPTLTVARAGLATTAGTAGTANSANTASVATNSNNLGGQPASAYLTSSTVQTLGLKKFSVGQTGQVIFQKGPFTLAVDCSKNGNTTTAALRAMSSEGGSSLGPNFNVPANSSLNIQTVDDHTSPGNQNENNAFINTLLAPSGAQIDVNGTVGVNGFGSNCYVSILILP